MQRIAVAMNTLGGVTMVRLIQNSLRAQASAKNLFFGCFALAAVSLLAVAASAADTTAATASSDEIAEVVVTGSLIVDPNHQSASPIVITTAADLQQSGAVTLESALNQLPMFAPTGTSANGGQGGGAHATLNLHGLGSNRNLVLLDGRRLPPADITGDVDINLIPDSILSGVQTITGGASAVYGSDAMSGVVNFITLKDFEGVAADAQYGNSFRSDLGQTAVSLAFGGKFADDKGHILVSVADTHREALLGNQRGFYDFVTPSSFIGQSTFVPSASNLPNQTTVNNLFASYGAATPVSNTLNLGFNNNGSLFTQTGAKNYQGPTTGDYADHRRQRSDAGRAADDHRKSPRPQIALYQSRLRDKPVGHAVRPVHVCRFGRLHQQRSQSHAVRQPDHHPGNQSVHPGGSGDALGVASQRHGAIHVERPLCGHPQQSLGRRLQDLAIPGRRQRCHPGQGLDAGISTPPTTTPITTNRTTTPS